MTKPKRIRTAGGSFDPSTSPLYFIASTSNNHHGINIHKHMLMAVNEMMTGRGLVVLERLINAGVQVMLDSGVFGLAAEHARQHGITVQQAIALPPSAIDGFDALLERYLEIVRIFEGRLWGYVEIDFGGMTQKIETRRDLEARGLSPIPVFHPATDPAEYFDELCERYERVAIGNIVRLPKQQRARLYAGLAERRKKLPPTWIHLLGMTPAPSLLAFHVESCDSSSWIALAKFAKNDVNVALTPIAEVEHLRHVAGSEADEDDPNAINTNEKAMQVGALCAHYEERLWRSIAGRYDSLMRTGA
jgi:hypothetical protein